MGAGTEFGKAMQEITGCVEQGDQQCSYDGLKTLTTGIDGLLGWLRVAWRWWVGWLRRCADS